MNKIKTSAGEIEIITLEDFVTRLTKKQVADSGPISQPPIPGGDFTPKEITLKPATDLTQQVKEGLLLNQEIPNMKVAKSFSFVDMVGAAAIKILENFGTPTIAVLLEGYQVLVGTLDPKAIAYNYYLSQADLNLTGALITYMPTRFVLVERDPLIE